MAYLRFILGSDNANRLARICTPQFFLVIISVLFVAYIAEIAVPTFSNDYYVDLNNRNSFVYAFPYDGRYLAEILRHVFGGVFPPSLVLMISLAGFIGCGLMVCLLFKVDDWAAAALTSALFATCPILFEVFSYTSIRVSVSLAAFMALLAMVTPSAVLGVVLIYLSMNLYQSGLYLAVIGTTYASALLLDQRGVGAVARGFVLPRAARVVAGGVLYYASISLISYLYPSLAPVRMMRFAHYTSSLSETAMTALALLKATWELYTKGIFLFPAFAKFLFIGVSLALIVSLMIRRNILGAVLVLLAPLLIYGAAWATYPPTNFLVDRVLFAFAGIYACTFLATWVVLPRNKTALCFVGWVIVGTFAFQANAWHQYMELKNRADMDLAAAISYRVKLLPGYERKLPLVILGTLQDENYLPFRVYDTKRDIVGNSGIASMHISSWATDRALMFYVDTRPANGEQSAMATAEAKTMPAWPADGSVAMKQGVIVIRLK